MSIVGVVAISCAAVFVFARYEQTVASGREVAQTLQPATEHANVVIESVSELDRSLQVYANTTSPAALQSFNSLYQQATSELDAIQAISSPGLEQARTDAQTVSADLATWRSQVADPVIRSVQAGAAAQARSELSAPQSLALFTKIERSSGELAKNIYGGQLTASQQTGDFIDQLGRALAVSAALAILALALAIFLVIKWVLRPLDRLRRQLRHVARRGHQNDPIIPKGPPEIAAAGSDAELMRRELVSQHDEARAATEGLAQEGPVVTGIRELLKPANPTFNTPAIEIAGSSQPAEGVMGGDWWDAFKLTDGRIATVLTDISGHGTDAAVTALNSKITVSHATKDTNELTHIASNLAECFGDSSFEATQADDRSIRFATSALLAFDPKTYELEWINAGHPAPIVIDSHGVVAQLGQTGPIMSMLGGDWQSQRITLTPGQSVIAWSDGLSESRNHDGKFLDDAGVVAVIDELNQQRATSASKLVPRVLARIRQQTNDWNHDDITLVVIRIH